MMRLLEGGNVFKDADGNPLTQRIDQADVPATIAWVEKVTGIQFPQERWLGSTGRKATSGDLDLAVDQTHTSKDQLVKQLTDWAVKNKKDPKLESFYWLSQSPVRRRISSPDAPCRCRHGSVRWRCALARHGWSDAC